MLITGSDEKMAFNWHEILESIKKDYSNLHIWLEKANVVYDEDTNILTIVIPDSLHQKTLLKYRADLEKAVALAFKSGVEVKIEINKQTSLLKKENTSKITIREQQIDLPLENVIAHIPTLNSKFRFDNFIVGDSNRFAHAACRAVAESPGQTYNPLFLYGGVGLGKTHLLHAIGTYIYEQDPSKKIMVITAEKFLFEVVQSIKENKMDDFRSRYRSADLLLVDDIQFLRGDSTTEEFFHTFNELYNCNKQIVATSDSPPNELKLEERLKSRFSAGIIVDIQPPNFETRVAILKQKAMGLNKEIPDNVIAYIAEHIDSNIRDLGSTLLTLIALSNDKEIEIIAAKQAIKMRNPKFEQAKKIGIDLIQQITSDYFGIKVQDLLSKKRHENIAKARQVAMYITRNLTDYSLVQIGQYFGGKDHTTVMHAIGKVENLIKTDDKFKTTIEELMMRVKK
jgi:chromosomal replication initiator protein